MRILRFRDWSTIEVLHEVVTNLDSGHRHLRSLFLHVSNMNPPVLLVIVTQHSSLAGSSQVIVEASYC